MYTTDMTDRLVGVAEIVSLLGISRQRVNQLAQEQGFPAPVATLTSGRIWEAGEVVAWARGERSFARFVDIDGVDRRFPVRDDCILVPAELVASRRSDPLLEWVRYPASVSDGYGPGGKPVKVTPLRLWDERLGPDGREIGELIPMKDGVHFCVPSPGSPSPSVPCPQCGRVWEWQPPLHCWKVVAIVESPTIPVDFGMPLGFPNDPTT